MVATGSPSLRGGRPPTADLHVVPESVELREHEVHVVLAHGRVAHDAPEEVRPLAQGLVPDHHPSFVHHPALQLGGDLGVSRRVGQDREKKVIPSYIEISIIM